jgi:hypothetical protein
MNSTLLNKDSRASTPSLDQATGLAPDLSRVNAPNFRRDFNVAQEAALKSLDSFQKLNPVEQKMVENIAAQLPEKDRIKLIDALLNRTSTNGQSIIEQVHAGKNLLEHLNEFANSNDLDSKVKARGFSREKILTDLVSAITDTGLAYQDDKASCMSCSLEYAIIGMSRNNSDLARVVACTTALATEGEFKTSRTTFKLTSELATDRRSSVSNLLQTAFMNEASDRGYNAVTDKVATNGKDPHKGLYSRQVEKLYENFTERAFGRVDRGDPKFVTTMEQSLRSGTVNVACVAGLGREEHALHAVNIVDPTRYNPNIKADENYVYFRNPWGRIKLRDGQGGAELVKGLENESIYRLPKAEFLSRTTYVLAEGGNFGTTPGANDEVERPMRFVVTEPGQNLSLHKQEQPVKGTAIEANPSNVKRQNLVTQEERPRNTNQGEDFDVAAQRAAEKARLQVKKKPVNSTDDDSFAA